MQQQKLLNFTLDYSIHRGVNMSTLTQTRSLVMVRLEDISSQAGVSIKTVSRTLRGESYVSADTRSRVLEIADRLGYRPNRAARSLRSKRGQEVKVVIWSMDILNEVAELQLQKIEGLERRLHAENLPLNIRVDHQQRSQPVYPEELISELVSEGALGVALFPFNGAILRRAVQTLENARIPTVVLDAPLEESGFDNVTVDRFHGIREAVLHLHVQGRRRIAYLGPDQVPSRLNGYHAGIEAVGLKPLYLFIPPTHTGEDLFQQGRASAKNLVHMETRPDAVQAYSDPLAMGFIEGLKELGVRVPQDIAVVGFDDRKMAVLMSPRLTTVAHPNVEVGEAAAEILLQKISGAKPPPGGWSRSIPARLVVRESA